LNLNKHKILNLTLGHNFLKLKFILAITIGSFFTSCEENFFPKLEDVSPQLVVDAWINNQPEPQTIRITQTQGYFDAVIPPGIQNAQVRVFDQFGRRFDFVETGTDGEYVWNPTPEQPSITEIGIDYHLRIDVDGQTFESISTMNRVPAMDSVTFRYEPGNGFFPESYFAEFYARDIIGPGDTYWIKAWKNGMYLNKPNEINIAFDAGFSAGGNIDGIFFIQPIRDGINPFEIDENDEFIPPYDPGDSVFVEIHSITYDAFVFLTEVRIQTDRQGGFAELFAVPLANVPTNIINNDPNGPQALGYFCVSAVSEGGKWLDPDNLPVE